MTARPLPTSHSHPLERVMQRCAGACAVCGSWTTQRVCTDCRARFVDAPARCWSCAERLPTGVLGSAGAATGRWARCGACLKAPPPIDRTIAALDYAFPWRRLMLSYKFHQALEVLPQLLSQLDETLDHECADAPDWLLPVPLSAQRLKERGFNQSLELARGLAARRGLRCDAALLLRVRHSQHQAGAARPDRQRQVQHAFAAEPSRLGQLRGKRVAVIDDVMTTGATLYEIARTLRQAGVAHIQAWVVARTPADLND